MFLLYTPLNSTFYTIHMYQKNLYNVIFKKQQHSEY